MCGRGPTRTREDSIPSVGVPCAAAPGPTSLTRGVQNCQPLLTGAGASICLPLAQVSLCPRQVKIMTEKELLAVACEQFLGKNVQDIKNVVLQTLEGHLRSILGEALPRL